MGRIPPDTDIINYKATTHRLLSDITIPIDAIHCTDTNCSLHKADIECFYDNIVYSLNKSADICLKTSKCSSSANHNVPGWNDYVKDQHNLARDAFLLWCNSGKPRQGVLYKDMVSERARFKYALRHCKTLEETAKADAMANHLRDKDVVHFWKSVKKN